MYDDCDRSLLCGRCGHPADSFHEDYGSLCGECAAKADALDNPVKGPLDLTGRIIAFEDGELDESGVLELFQHLVDTGLAWTLQGSYGRHAKYLLESGMIHPAR